MVRRVATSIFVIVLAAHVGAQSKASSGDSGRTGSAKLPVWATTPAPVAKAPAPVAKAKAAPARVASAEPRSVPVPPTPTPPTPKPTPVPDAGPVVPTERPSVRRPISLIWSTSDRKELLWQLGGTLPSQPPALAALPIAATLPVWPVLSDIPPVPTPAVAPTEPQKPVAVPTASKPASPAPPRWIDMQTLTISTRYRYVDTSAGVVTNNQAQHNEQLKVRFKFDAAGKYGVTAGLATGNTFTGGWENAGIGTPNDFFMQVYLKQLYLSASPVKGLEFQMGGLFLSRGEGTEITTYDNDGYIVGERATLKRPADWYFDEVSVTRGYIGDTAIPNLLRRTDRLTDWNYYQVLFDKKFSPRFAASTDLTGVSGVRTARAAVYAKMPGLVVVDGARIELYRRLDGLTANGYAMTLERAPVSWATVGAGIANIDRNYGGLNADRFNKGQRWFVNGSVTFLKDLTLSAFYQRAFGNDYTLANRSRLDVILQLNALKALQRRGIF